MKFGVYLENNQIPEWREFYIDYQILKNLLKPLERNYKAHIKKIAREKNIKTELDLEDSKELLQQLEEPLLDENSEFENHGSKFTDVALETLTKEKVIELQIK